MCTYFNICDENPIIKDNRKEMEIKANGWVLTFPLQSVMILLSSGFRLQQMKAKTELLRFTCRLQQELLESISLRPCGSAVEQLTRNEQIVGSIPIRGSKRLMDLP